MQSELGNMKANAATKTSFPDGLPFSVKVKDFKKKTKPTIKVMLAQMSSEASKWSRPDEIFRYSSPASLTQQIRRFTAKAIDFEVDLMVFPELSVPESALPELRLASKKSRMVIIAGSHYYKKPGVGNISRCPVIINGKIYFTEKIHPSHDETSMFPARILNPGSVIRVFRNTSIGTFAVLICLDYLKLEIRTKLYKHELDILCVPAFQKTSNTYHHSMDTESHVQGLYIIYPNMLSKPLGDGRSALFAITESKYFKELISKKMAVDAFRHRLFELRENGRYIIIELSLKLKRPFYGHAFDSRANAIVHADGQIVRGRNRAVEEAQKKKMPHKIRKSHQITEAGLADFVKSSEIVSRIDMDVAGATSRPVVYADRFVHNYVSRVQYLQITSFDQLALTLIRSRTKLIKILIAFCDTPIGKSWSFTPSGMCISFLCYTRILKTSGIAELTEFLTKYRFNQLPPEEVAASIFQAYTQVARRA
jgi:predicted amidohydrolase